MEPLSPTYPNVDDVGASHQETNAQPLETERSATAMYPSFTSPSHRASTSSDPSVGETSHQLHQSHYQLYSPTRFELESHPVRQRLSSTTVLGSAPEEPHQAHFDSSRQAQQGSERLFDAMAEAPTVKEGDKVSDPSYASNPGGTVTQVVTEGAVTMETKRGNEVKKSAEPDNPALYIERSGHDQVKKASEVNVDKKGDAHKEEEKKAENGEPQTGDKRAAEESAEDKKEEEEGDAKKQKTDEEPKENGEKPKKKGRPAKKDSNGNSAPKKDTKKREPKKAATETGEPRRSGRQASKSS